MASSTITGTIKYITGEDPNSVYKSMKLGIYEPNKTNSKYDNIYDIQVRPDQYELISKFKIGASVNVTVNIFGVEYRSKRDQSIGHITNLGLWKIEYNGAESGHFSALQQNSREPEPDDIPF